MSANVGTLEGVAARHGLQAGEQPLWQGGPEPGLLARHALHVRKFAIYFVLLLAWRVGSVLSAGGALAEAGSAALTTTLLGTAVCLLLWCYARWAERAISYTITDQRVVIRGGVALPITVTIPIDKIESASLRARGEASGDIILQTVPGIRAAYVILWPNVQPMRFFKPRPMLRCLADARVAAEALRKAIEAQMQGARVEAPQQPITPMLDQDHEEDHDHGNPVSGVPAVAMLALVGLTLIGVAWQQYVINPAAAHTTVADGRVAVQSEVMHFFDRPGGMVEVQNADGDTIRMIAPGEGSFVRVTLRGLVRERRQTDSSTAPGFELRRFEDGSAEVVDLSTMRRIDLRAFGEIAASQFTELLDLAGGEYVAAESN